MIATRGLGRGGQGYIPISGLGRGEYVQVIVVGKKLPPGGILGHRAFRPLQNEEETELVVLLALWVQRDELF